MFRQLFSDCCKNIIYCLLFCAILFALVIQSDQLQSLDQHQIVLRTDPITLDLYHKFSSSQEFKLRGSIVIKPKTEYRIAQASILNQNDLTEEDLRELKQSYERGDNYYLKASIRPKKTSDVDIPTKTSQIFARACSLYLSNFADYLTINLSPTNEFLNVNFHTTDTSCSNESPSVLSKQFNTTILVESTSLGPIPDTATYIKRLEDERKNKSREGKEDNRSFLAKYWVYIVPAVLILMIFSGPVEQAGR